jgi:hypothetical protein
MRDIYPTFGNVKAFESLMKITITQENTLLGMELELMCIEWSEIRPTSIPEGAHATIVGFFLEQDLKRRREIKDFGWKTID